MRQSEILQFVASVFSRQAYILESLDTPGTNQHYRVMADKPYFLKVFQTNALQVVSREQQFELQSQVATYGLAPKPIALSDCQRFWIEEWLATSESTQANQQINTARLGRALSLIHALKVTAPVLELSAEWQRYLSLAGQATAPLKARMAAYQHLFDTDNDSCFCHNDLHHSHVSGGHTLTVLDWEYAALGNRYFDLAGCILVNQMTEQQQVELLAAYAKNTGLDRATVTTRTTAMLPVVDFTSQLWNCAYTKIQQQ